MAVGVHALRSLTEDGVAVDEAAGLIEFRLAVTDEQFPTIAKLRAARRLWDRVLELSGAAPRPMRQHAVTSRPMMSVYDPWVNMLRTTVAAFAAGVGGADAITVVPFDGPLGETDALARRIARNTSALLISESHVARVADPAGGSYAVEKLTDDLAVAAWDAVRPARATVPTWPPLVVEAAAARERQVATRKRPITGLSEFPNLGETLPSRLASGSTGDVATYDATAPRSRRCAPTRRSAQVFLATLGPVAAHTARAGFAANLFAAGGIAVDVAGATAGVDDLVAAYDGQARRLPGRHRADVRRVGRRGCCGTPRGRCHPSGRGGRRDRLDRRALRVADDSCALGVDAIDFLTRTREALS